MKNHFSKRLLAFFIAICFVFGQSNLPAGLFHLNLDGILETKAAETFTEKLTVYNIIGGETAFDVTFTFTINGANTVALTAVVSSEMTNVGSSRLDIPQTVTHGGTTYTITAIGHENYTGSGDVLSGLTGLQEVSIPSTVTTIYPQSFANDRALKKVTFIESAENDTSQLTTIGYGAFQGCFAVAPTGTSSNIELLLPARLTSIGASAFQDCSYLAKVTVNTNSNSPSTFTVGESAFKNDTNLATVELPNYTTTIGKECFKTCRNLLNCNLPSQLTAIEDSTFEGCTNLWKELGRIPFPAITTLGKRAFYNCSSIQAISLENTKLETISSEAFYNCSNISGSPYFNEDLKTIGDKAFFNCASLCSGTVDGKPVVTNLKFPAALSTIGASAFESCAGLGGIDWGTAKITSIGKSAFKRCTNLDYFAVPKDITEIPEELCQYCTKIGRLDIPVTATSIGNYAFSGCTSLASISYYKDSTDDRDEYGTNFQASQMTKIGTNAFDSSGLTAFYMPAKVTIIDDYTFNDCTKLDMLQFNSQITTIGNYAFTNCSTLCSKQGSTLTIPSTVNRLGTNAFQGCSGLESITIASSSLTALSDSVFADCSALESVELPASITSLGGKSFQNDANLTTLTMPGFSSITEIGSQCFEGCSNFAGFNSATDGSISFPATLASLGQQAFKNCKKIESVDLSATTIRTIGSSTFSGTNLQIISMPTTLATIAASAFEGCTLNNMAFTNTKVPTIDATALKNLDGTKKYIDEYSIKIGVPASSKSDYIALFNTKLGFNLTEDQFYDKIVNASSIKLTTSGGTNTYIGGTLKTTVTQNGTEAIKYTSSNDAIATVDGAGVITGISIGTATITATTYTSGLSSSITVSVISSPNAKDYVSNPIVSITPNPTQIGTSDNTFFAGDAITVDTSLGYDVGALDKTVDSITWTLPQIDPSNPVTGPTKGANGTTTISNGYVSITYTDESAQITALKYCNKQIAAVCSSSCTSVTIPITISPSLTALTVKKESDTITFSSSPINLKSKYFTLTPANSPEPITWQSNNENIATVNSNGELTCVGVGTVVVTATGEKSGVSAQITLDIQNNISTMSTSDNKNTYEVLAGQAFSFTATASYTNQNIASNDTITWASSNPAVANVSATQSGNVYTVNVQSLTTGSTRITATNSANKILLTITVTAKQLTLEKKTFTMYTKGPNKKATIKITSTLPADANVTYAMANAKSKKVASVSSKGVITAKKTGKATVKVTVYGQTTEVNVTVLKGTLTVSIPGAALKKTTFTISKSRKKATIAVTPNYLLTTKKKVTYKSSKKSVATVSKKGVLKFKKKGTTKLKITCNGVKATYTLKVK